MVGRAPMTLSTCAAEIPDCLSFLCHRVVTRNTVGGRNPAPPNMYETLKKMGSTTYQLVQDFFHRQYVSAFQEDIVFFHRHLETGGLLKRRRMGVNGEVICHWIRTNKVISWYGCFQKIGVFPTKWMVKINENNGKPLLKWMIWGYHYFWKHPICFILGTCSVGFVKSFYHGKVMQIITIWIFFCAAIFTGKL